MAAPLTTKPQVSGYKFLLRRLEHALLRRDTRMIHDPMRAQSRSLWIGVALAVVVCLGAGVLAMLRPQGQVGDAAIVLAKDSGALYVRVGERLHPVLNLTSARLISGSAESPRTVSDGKLGDYPRGPLLGIPGAPATISTGGGTPTWTVCDSAVDGGGVETGVLAGDTDRTRTPLLAAGQAILATDGTADYLLYEGKRARIDPADTIVMRALNLDGASPREVSVGALDTLPLVDDLALPTIDRAGEPGAVPGHAVGSVIRATQTTGTEYYVVLADGVQQVSEAAAAVIRAGDTNASVDLAEVTPAELNNVARLDSLPVQDFPTVVPTVLTVERAPVLCVSWSRTDADPDARLQIAAGQNLPLPGELRTTPMAGADGPGPRTDWYATPGAVGWWVQSTNTTGPADRAESLGYVSGQGVRFTIPDTDTSAMLGLTGTPTPIAWSINRLLTPGPELSRDNALVAHDAVLADPNGREVAVATDGG